MEPFTFWPQARHYALPDHGCVGRPVLRPHLSHLVSTLKFPSSLLLQISFGSILILIPWSCSNANLINAQRQQLLKQYSSSCKVGMQRFDHACARVLPMLRRLGYNNLGTSDQTNFLVRKPLTRTKARNNISGLEPTWGSLEAKLFEAV